MFWFWVKSFLIFIVFKAQRYKKFLKKQVFRKKKLLTNEKANLFAFCSLINFVEHLRGSQIFCNFAKKIQ
jgi:hypothetical protein